MQKPNTMIHDGQTLFQVPGFPAYYIDKAGGVYSTYRKHGSQAAQIEQTIQRKLVPFRLRRGYLQYDLFQNEKPKMCLGHRILCELFHGPAPVDRSFACHRNDIATDNRPANLYWGSRSQNAIDAYRNGRIKLHGEYNPRAKLTELDVLSMRKKLSDGASVAKCAVEFDVCIATVSHIKTGRNWSYLNTRQSPE